VKVGLTGFSAAGKTTVFNALTGLSAPTTGGGDGRPNLGVIKVPDARVDKLTEIHRPKKTTYAEMSFIDFPPPRTATQKRAVLDADTVAQLRDADALVEVVRGFPDLAGAAPTPVADLEGFGAELLLADLAVLEKRLERVKKEKGHERERPLLERCVAALGDGTPLRKLLAPRATMSRGGPAGLSPEDRGTLSGFALLTLRPLLIVLNVGESDAATAVPADVAARAADEGAEALVLSAKVEAELTALDAADRAAFLADLGLQASARDRFIQASYALLDLISFLTAGDDECRAWPIRRGTSALKAAGRIHSDIERGFIRAEVVSFEDFVTLGSEAKCRAAGKLRLEGKDYVVQDGDIVHFRFAV
jgi:GTP-binding protein YchF